MLLASWKCFVCLLTCLHVFESDYLCAGNSSSLARHRILLWELVFIQNIAEMHRYSAYFRWQVFFVICCFRYLGWKQLNPYFKVTSLSVVPDRLTRIETVQLKLCCKFQCFEILKQILKFWNNPGCFTNLSPNKSRKYLPTYLSFPAVLALVSVEWNPWDWIGSLRVSVWIFLIWHDEEIRRLFLCVCLNPQLRFSTLHPDPRKPGVNALEHSLCWNANIHWPCEKYTFYWWVAESWRHSGIWVGFYGSQKI